MKYGLLVYLVSKYIELLDTIFMVLRQKQRQISFLHVSKKRMKHNSLIFYDHYMYAVPLRGDGSRGKFLGYAPRQRPKENFANVRQF